MLLKYGKKCGVKFCMNICFTADEKFIPQLEVTLVSILKNANKEDELSFYLITDGLKATTKKHLMGKYPNLHILEIEVSEELKRFPLISNNSYIVYLRLKIPALLSQLDKVLYLDCDLIVNGSLSQLYDSDVSNYHVAAVLDKGAYKYLPKHIERLGLKDYFNAGVLLMNLSRFREDALEEKCYEILSSKVNTIIFQDQDVLNIVCEDNVLFLDSRFNLQVGCGDALDSCKKELIVHYVGADKPWLSVKFEKYWSLYWKYVLKSKYWVYFVKVCGMGILKKYKKIIKYTFKHV